MTSYHMVFKNGYFGSINKCGGLPTHLPEIWPQIDGADLAVADGLFCREIDGLFCRSSPDSVVRRRCVLSLPSCFVI